MKILPYNTNQNNTSFQSLPKKFQAVDNYLIRGPHPNIVDLIHLKKEGVTQIYDFRHISIRGIKFVEKIACNFMDIKYKRKPYSNLHGEYPTIKEFEEIANSVKKNGDQGGKTLFHCNSGRHRTAHMSAFYRITKGEHSLAEIREQLGDRFKQTAIEIIKSEVVNKGYYSRKRSHYNGYNPIKHLFSRINNRYAEAIRRGQKMFCETIMEIRK